jgi:hypothetical protein
VNIEKRSKKPQRHAKINKKINKKIINKKNYSMKKKNQIEKPKN